MRQVNSKVDITAPSIAKYGVLSPASTTIDLESGHWESDFIYQIADAGVTVENAIILGGDPDRTTDSVQVVESNNHHGHLAYHPFNIQTKMRLSTMGTNPADIETSARDALTLVAQKAIERELWEGGVAKLLATDPMEGNRYLAGSLAVDVTPTPGTALKPKYALAVLEYALGASTLGYEGTIHAPRDVASVLRVKADGNVLKTNLGTSVIAGTGYTKMGPNGAVAPAGKAWMYATGPVTVILGKTEVTPEKLNQAVDVSTNTISYFVDRPAAVVWSTSDLFAVYVDLTLDYA